MQKNLEELLSAIVARNNDLALRAAHELIDVLQMDEDPIKMTGFTIRWDTGRTIEEVYQGATCR